jgi:hypothetical protein
MEEKYNASLLAAGMHCEAQQLIAEVIINFLRFLLKNSRFFSD